MATVKKDDRETFVEMINRMQSEGDHGKMTKEEWDTMVDKWMVIYHDIKKNEKNPLLLSWDDVQAINAGKA